jgi:uncharacterized coiled-coil DUF342 family protein
MQAVITKLLGVSKRLSELSQTTATYRTSRPEIAAELARLADECLGIVEKIKRTAEKKAG